jgi:predicted CoA-substrate-specific enzyme activase
MTKPSAQSTETPARTWATGAARTYLVGIDVGSTTVKVVVRTPESRELLFHRYQKHESRQPETVLALLRTMKHELSAADGDLRLFMTGSGGQAIAELLGARFVQEVAAVSVAVEALHPDVRSVIELGGQDAKIVLFEDGKVEGTRKKIATMNDKCAGGTGVVIEKIAAKLHVPSEELLSRSYDEVPTHAIAGKCGVFAETDITGLMKQGTPSDQLMASLFQAIVLQNLSVLTRGHTLWPKVLLLGGPNTFFPGLRVAWKRGLKLLWERKQVPLPEGASLDDMIQLPENAELYAALGAIEFGWKEAEQQTGSYQGTEALEAFLRERDAASKPQSAALHGLCTSDEDLAQFTRDYALPTRKQRAPQSTPLAVYIGIDGGSTSTKAVALDAQGEVVASSYRLSEQDPLADAARVLGELREALEKISPLVEILGFGTTGYSKALLKRVLGADVEVVETVAHAKASQRLFPKVETIVDVGGQDIKIILLHNGAVRDFKLNTQCSAGNGYFLQAAAEQIGIPVERFAETAFRARRIPQFSYGCAVFLQSDIVNFQRQGWQPEEILAGLASVLPKNVFQYVAGVSNTASLGRHFVLQGGTQRNLAVVKTEVDFIREHFHGEGEPEIVVHPNCSEAGAIGAALEAIEHRKEESRASNFCGFAQLDALRYTMHRDESTRCGFCTNHCMRTFLDLEAHGDEAARRVIIATCERGEAENAAAARQLQAVRTSVTQDHPNFVQMAGVQAWAATNAPEAEGKSGWFRKRSTERHEKRAKLHIGIPRALNMYTYGPLFSAYFESLGIPAKHLHYSHYSNAKSYQQAAGFSPVDPCYPSKVAISHVYELLDGCQKRPLDAIFFPMFDVLTSSLAGCAGANSCPSGSATPEAVKSAFWRSVNWFERAHVQYVNPVLNMQDRSLFRYQMYTAWKDLLDLDWDENARAVEIAYAAWASFENRFRQQARTTIDALETRGEIGLVMLGRPYHHDPGLNHGILDELQRKGYPIFSQSLLPMDEDLLDRLFGKEVRSGAITSPVDLSDVWKHTFSASSNQKLWAAKFVARHPNLVSVELSNFKCGHDAFLSQTLELIAERSGKPHFSFRDLDENCPLASIRIRVETIDYFLRQYHRQLHSGRAGKLPPSQTEQQVECFSESTGPVAES